jgi:protease-4
VSRTACKITTALPWFWLALVTVAGCKSPLRAVTDNRVIVHNSAAEDRGPLVEMPVIPSPGCQHGKIALIDVDGLLLNMNITGFSSLGENPVAVFREKLDRIKAAGCYCAVVLRINSRGGGATATDIMWRDLCSFKAETGLPVVACLMDTATGGAYYLATAADHIVAHPTTITGGIGVIFNLYNLEESMALQSIIGTPVKSGKYIDLGTTIRPPTEEGRRLLESIAEDLHARFCRVVREARPGVSSNQEVLFDGRIFTAGEALEYQLVDSIGYLDDALNMAKQMGGAPRGQVVILHRRNDRARSPYAISPNSPEYGQLLRLSLPGFDRSKMPTFLYLWVADPTIEP